ncbi:MAG: DUF6340 family protein [Bacteroidota bacterium]
MYKNTFLFLSVFLTVTMSCKPAYDSISIKTNATSETIVAIPQELNQKKLIILDRTVCINEPHATTNNGPTINAIKTEAFSYLKKEIREREFYTYDNSVKASKAVCTNRFFPVPMKKDSLSAIAAQRNVLLTVENIVYSEKDEFRKDVESTYDKNNVLIRERNVIIGEKKLTAQAALKVYDTLGMLMDSLSLNEQYAYEVKETNKLIAQRSLKKGRELAVENIGKKLGFKIAESISPYYIAITRNYFANSRTNTRFDRAHELIADQDDWYSASIVWGEITQRYEDKTDRAKAYYNLGVFHEKNGDVEKAIQMLEESTALNQEVGGKYLSDLKKRYKND